MLDGNKLVIIIKSPTTQVSSGSIFYFPATIVKEIIESSTINTKKLSTPNHVLFIVSTKGHEQRKPCQKCTSVLPVLATTTINKEWFGLWSLLWMMMLLTGWWCW